MHSPNSIKSKFSPNRILPLSFSDLIPLNVSMVIVWLLPLERFENYSILTVHVNLLVIFYRFRKRVILLDKIKRPARDVCLCMGELQAPPAPAAPHFVFLITL